MYTQRFKENKWTKRRRERERERERRERERERERDERERERERERGERERERERERETRETRERERRARERKVHTFFRRCLRPPVSLVPCVCTALSCLVWTSLNWRGSYKNLPKHPLLCILRNTVLNILWSLTVHLLPANNTQTRNGTWSRTSLQKLQLRQNTKINDVHFHTQTQLCMGCSCPVYIFGWSWVVDGVVVRSFVFDWKALVAWTSLRREFQVFCANVTSCVFVCFMLSA